MTSRGKCTAPHAVEVKGEGRKFSKGEEKNDLEVMDYLIPTGSYF